MSHDLEKTVKILTNYCIDLENRLKAIDNEADSIGDKLLDYYDANDKEEFFDSTLKADVIKKIYQSSKNISTSCWIGDNVIGENVYKNSMKNTED